VVDDSSNNIYPYPTLAADQNDVLVGRIRKDFNQPNKLHLFCVADNILKGAALNAVQIMMGLIQRSDS
jgi:aspartate-semialdehyde dehydrogenase